MNTKLLMSVSALFMGIAGIILSFLPEELTAYFGLSATGIGFLFLQLLGALYVAFAILNWMARGNLIGGIYSKPVAMGNFAHFFIGGLTLLNAAISRGGSVNLWSAAIVYSIFALLFGLVAFGDPLKTSRKE